METRLRPSRRSARLREVVIDDTSLLEEVSHNAGSFRVSDYDPAETVSVHRKGDSPLPDRENGARSGPLHQSCPR